jgi:hypothetical protein
MINWKGFGRLNFRYHTGICLEGLKEITQNLTRSAGDSPRPVQALSRWFSTNSLGSSARQATESLSRQEWVRTQPWWEEKLEKPSTDGRIMLKCTV